MGVNLSVLILAKNEEKNIEACIRSALFADEVLVIDDMLGKNKDFSPKFLRRYADLYTIMTDAIGLYVGDVKSGNFPGEQESY